MIPKNKPSVLRNAQKFGLILFIGIAIGVVISLVLIIVINSRDTQTLSLQKNELPQKQGYQKLYNSKTSFNNSNKPPKPFYFNPNKVSYEELISFGLSPKQSGNIVNFVKAGGRFYKKDGLKKLYCMDDSLYKKLEPWIVLDKLPAKDTSSKPSFTQSWNKKEKDIFELNAADTLDLQRLRGIGPSYSRRIYNYGKKLGGYVKIEQLKEVYGMNDTLYKSIIPFLIVKPNPSKININTSTIKQLNAHPYIDFFQAKAIIILREDIKGIKSLEDIRQINLIDQTTYEKLLPYIEL